MNLVSLNVIKCVHKTEIHVLNLIKLGTTSQP